MTPAEIRAAIRDFLDLLENGRGSEQENWRQLVRSLDLLAWAYHAAAEHAELDSEAPDAPRTPYEERRALAVKRFPDFGYYNQVDSFTTDIAGQDLILVRDAIDDLAEIAGELQQVEWLWAHTSECHALGMYRIQFNVNAMEYTRYLQLYLSQYRYEQRPSWLTEL